MITWNGQAVLDEISHRIDQSAHRIGQEVVQVAQTYAPVDTGFLRSSISYAYDNVSHSISFIVGAPYGIFVEYGTRHSHAHPYLRPALNTVGTIYGFETSMKFTNVIPTDKELLARGPGFIGGKGLTEGQKRHVRHNLKPVSERHHIGNVSRSKLRVEHRF
jgi:HK97 gp10 family phage protein